MGYLTVDNILTIIGLLIAIAAVVVAYFQLSLINKQIYAQKKAIVSQYEWERRHSSLNYSITRQEKLRESLIKLDKVFGVIGIKNTEPITLTEIDDAIRADGSIYRDIVTILGHWENMALAIHVGVADEDVAHEMVSGIVINTVKVFRNFIDRRREQNPKAYLYLIHLARLWEDRRLGVNKKSFEFLPIL